MSDELIELPEGWAWTSFEELAERIPNALKAGPFGSALKKSFYVPSGYKIYGQEQVINEDPFYGDYYIDEERYEALKSCAVKPGDILISLVGTIGKVLILPNGIKPGIINPRLVKLSLDKSLSDNDYIKKYLESPSVRNYFSSISHGGTMDILNLSILKTLKIPLPPLNEQKRIIAKIEELNDRHQRAKQALEAIPELCDRFRQSVLAAAFRGDLTADWREENPDVEPASILLERIREKRLTEAKTDKQKQSLEDIYSYEQEYGLELLPEGWKYLTLEKLCHSFQYGTSAKSLPEGEVPVLRMGNLQNGEIDWADLVYTSDKDEITKYHLNPGDVLFNRTNSPELVGKTSIYRGERAAIFAGYLIKIGNYTELDSEYLNYCLNTNYAKDYCWRVKTDGVSQSNINAQKLAKFEIPFCSLEEQKEIVYRIHSLFKVIAQVEQQHWYSEKQLDRLNQSILAKAFRGELVEQDPNDEPASVLLDRIRAEREALQGNKKSGSTRGKRKKATDKQLDLPGMS